MTPTYQKGATVPILVAVLTVTRSGRTEVRALPYAGPPLWLLLAHEAADVLRRLRIRAPRRAESSRA